MSKVIYLGTSPNDINFGKDIFTSTKLTTLIVPNAKNEKDEGWKTFLGGSFTDIRKQ